MTDMNTFQKRCCAINWLNLACSICFVLSSLFKDTPLWWLIILFFSLLAVIVVLYFIWGKRDGFGPDDVFTYSYSRRARLFAYAETAVFAAGAILCRFVVHESPVLWIILAALSLTCTFPKRK